jgi:SAM-dependent methyltransferase
MDVRASYDSAAAAYAEHLADELEQKPLDRHVLNRFAESTRGRGLVADVGCGPGHVAAYLHHQRVDTVGIDLSARMIDCARRLHPNLEFRIGDMRHLDFPDGLLAGLLCFYAIVHFTDDELPSLAVEFRRVLAAGGLALFAFHVGHDVVHRDELFGAPVNLDFRFHDVAVVTGALRHAGLEVIEHTEREPYPDIEYQSRRCYLLAKAT